MKKIRILSLTTATVLLLIAWAFVPTGESYAAQAKIRVAVMDFENNATGCVWWWCDWQHLGRAAGDELVTQLVRTGKFSVVERDKLDLVLKEQSLGASGAISPNTAVQLGRLLGVQLILTGSITKFSIKKHSARIGPLGVGGSLGQAQSALDVRLINTTTGEIVLVASGQGEKKFGGASIKGIDFEKDFDVGIISEALRPAVEKTVSEIVDQYSSLSELQAAAGPSLGKILSVDSPTMVIIDMGENSGVKTGDRFKVERVIKEIRDDQGELLDAIKDQTGTLEVTRVLSKSSICKIVSGSAQKGDTIIKQ